ncbi:MAG TPA: class I SAM-dependent methyltransferase [Pirellulales bacterium]|nr:class I SAM-dependent methyltransferase [Pirellulales bacterium]
MSTKHFAALMEYIDQRHPRSLRGIEEARAAAPGRFDDIAAMYLDWLVSARGPQGIKLAADAFVQFSTDVNMAQARYEAESSYQHKSFAEVYADHYSQNETMSGYLWGIYLTNFLWAHHTQICLFFRDTFLSRLSDSAQLVEIAPGHGGWGAWALNVLPKAQLTGFDISPQSMEIANSVAKAAGVADRAKYTERDALDLAQMPAASADGVICSFLVEHLEQPEKLFAVISHLLKPRGFGFVTGALTAAQVDHIYEFRYESELVKMCEDHGLRVLATLSANPARTLPKARYMPRSMALLVQKRINDIY